MKDNIVKLFEQLLSGSINNTEKTSESSVPTNIGNIDQNEDTIKHNEEKDNDLESIFKEIISAPWVEEQLLTSGSSPGYMLKKNKKGYYWLIDTQTRAMCKVAATSELFLLEESEDEKTYCMIGTGVYLIPNELIVCLGYN